jgi:hypothetical protein
MRLIAAIIGFLIVPALWAGAHPDSPLDQKSKVIVVVFLSADCPISNRVAPELERIRRRFATNDVAMRYVYPNRSDDEERIQKHRREYRLTAPFLRDTEHKLVELTGVKVTPEAAVFDAARALVYRGRVNDQFLALGKARPDATTHDLEAAIEAVLAGRPPAEARTRAVGCYIEAK